MKAIISTVTSATLLISASSFGVAAHESGLVNEQCNVHFEQDISITPNHILVIENNQTIYDIYNNDTLFYKGEKVDLNAHQVSMLKQFATETRSLVPAITEIALEAVGIAFEGIQIGLGQFGENAKLDYKLDDIRQRLEEKFSKQDGYYSFSQGEFNMDFADEELDRAIEETIEQALPSIIGGVLQLVGTAIANGDSEFNEMGNIEEKIEAEIEARAELLEAKADEVCVKVKALDELETQLRDSSPELSKFDLITVKNTK